jgi:chromosome segregation ATPase
MPKPSKLNAMRRENLTATQAVLEQNSDQVTLERSVLESQTRLHTARQQIASLESALSQKVADCSELMLSLQEAGMRSKEQLSQLSEKKAQYQSLYKELCLERQRTKRAHAKRAVLEQQISVLNAAAAVQAHEFKNMSSKAQKTMDLLLQLESQNSTLKTKLSQYVENFQTEIKHCQNRLGIVQKNLSDFNTSPGSYKKSWSGQTSSGKSSSKCSEEKICSSPIA